MRNAERGSSQIPFVICLLFLMGTAMWAYTEYQAREAADSKLTEICDFAKASDAASPATVQQVKDLIKFAKGDGRRFKEQLEKIGEAVGAKNETDVDLIVDVQKIQSACARLLENADKKDFTVEFPVDRIVEEAGSGNVKVSDSGGKVVVSYFGNRDLRGLRPDMTNIVENVITPGMTRMVAEIKRYRDKYSEALNAKETAEASYRTTLDAKDAEIRAKVEEATAIEARKNQDITELRRQLSEAEAKAASAEDEKNKAVTSLTADLKSAKADQEKKAAEVQVLKARRRAVEEDTSPDGEVLSVSEDQKFVVVNIGRTKNNLLAGTNFDVYAIGKGGQEIPKGVLKVTQVDAGSSNCTVLALYDSFTPIAPTDKIRSITYSPKETVHIALVGRFQKMGKSDAARRLQSLGVVVDDQVTVHTTYLVVGEKESEAQPIEETPEFKTAEMYGIQKISERELTRFTMY